MKFTQTEATNQRIEKISMQHAVVGVDIAKEVHAAQITDFRGRCLANRHLSFTNTLEGFERLLSWVKDVQAKKRLSSIIVGLEPTGHYWFHLANWLLSKGIEVALVNPVTTHRNKENRDNSPSKNDPKDALVIADVVSRGYYTEYSPQAESLERLKTTISNREYWSKISVSVTNRIIRWIDLYFPEFRRVFPDWTVKRSLATLRAFPLPDDLKTKSVEQVIEGWYEQGMRRAAGATGIAKASELLLIAKRSIGESRALEEARQDIQRLLEEYERTIQILEEIQVTIEQLLGEIPVAKSLLSIPGIGKMTIAVLLGCAGDPRNYAHGRQLLRRAGLNLAERTSGKFKGKIKLSKRGDRTLRKHLFLGVLNLVRQNADFKRWHEHNQKKGMTKMASIFKLHGKLARIIVGMVQRGESYCAKSDLQVA